MGVAVFRSPDSSRWRRRNPNGRWPSGGVMARSLTLASQRGGEAMLRKSIRSRIAGRAGAARCRAGSERGFTLIELLTVVAVLSVLAAIALQTYHQYRAAGFDARAMHDVGNAAVAQEAHYANAHTYVDFDVTGPAVLAVPGLVVSDTITLHSVAG